MNHNPLNSRYLSYIRDMKWVYWSAIAILLMLLGWQVHSGARKTEEIQGVKAELFARDSLIRINDSLVTCLVHDLETYKTLAALVPDRITVRKPILVTQVEYVYRTERDTIFTQTDGMIEDFYPDRNDWVIRHWVTPFSDGTFFSDWEFRPVLLDLVINEKSKGLYEAQLAGPAFLEVRNLKVNSLPLDPPPSAKGGFLIGGGVGYDWKNRTAQPILHAGYQWGKHTVFGSTQLNQASANYLYRLK